MAHTRLVPQPLEKSDKKHDYNTINKKFGATPGSTKISPTASKALPTSAPDRLTMQDIINASLRKSTCQTYLSYQTRWKEYCAEKNLLYDSPTVDQFLNFFTELFNQGVSHSVLISAKSAVAHVLRMKYRHIPQHPSVIKFFKGSFNLRPPLSRLFFVWDVQIMFEYFRSLGNNRQISDKHLSHKLLILLLLLGGQRLNSVFHFTIDRIIISNTSVTFSPKVVLKQSKPGPKLDIFEYRAYSDTKLCVLECVKEYIHRRNDRVNKEQKRLFITYRKPYRTASIDILCRWIKETFAETNLIENLAPRSCRSASTTKAFNMNLDILDIVRKACWSNAKTFLQHYKKEIVSYEGVDFNKIVEY